MKANKKIWFPQNDEEYEYMRYCYNVNATYRIPSPYEVYPHEGVDNDDYFNTRIKNEIIT